MPRLLIGNDFNEDRVSIVDAKRNKTAWWSQRLLWFAQDDDVLVTAVPPDEAYLEYVTGLTGTRRSSLRVVVPPPGELGVGVLSADRLADEEFLGQLRAAIGDRPVERIVPLHPDASVAGLARALHTEDALPGCGFLSQGGGRLANSKPAFRALAAGVGAPLPAGGVCASRSEAQRVIGELVDAGYPVILKHEFRTGGRGNEILSPVAGVAPVGAPRAVVVPDRAALRGYLERRWDWLSSHGQSPVVAERYFPGSRAVFAEFALTDGGVAAAGQGEMMSAPLAAAQIVPIPGLHPDAAAELDRGGRRISAALHAMGYRGMLSADAVVTPDGAVLFTEYNGRITGSTPVYRIIGERVVGADYAETRVLLDRDGWPVPSFRAAVDRVAAAGLAYDPVERTGVVFTMPYNPGNGTIRYCVVAESPEAARERSRTVHGLFTAVAT
ncbi:peptide ligase PGM1-related protein [Streptomyces sp. GMR22]|uniref:preATP grasp domain-containing protein n=1 Tax=Streptomyces sp. GMR22 TaxID=2759524 RepID=UPI0015FD4116|nr:peptide ligase PGM1-related protein [Streptomyces sp. GMR22]MBA6439095.1 hypothetical protein [Streptomyces sp. GMR22]